MQAAPPGPRPPVIRPSAGLQGIPRCVLDVVREGHGFTARISQGLPTVFFLMGYC
jgi:hypothetical protein